MQNTTEHAGTDLLSSGTIPIEDNPIRKLMLGFLDPSEMTQEERMDERASILAAGFLILKGGLSLPTGMSAIYGDPERAWSTLNPDGSWVSKGCSGTRTIAEACPP